MHSARMVVTAAVLVLGGCVVSAESVDAEAGAPAVAPQKEAPVIVGNVDWVEAGSLPTSNPRRQVASAVAYLSLPAKGTRCTGFLITADVLMTNHHCVSRAQDAAQAYAIFDYMAGVPDSLREYVDCSEFLGADSTLDMALLRCTDRPGDRHGVVSLSESTPASGDDIYVVHQNCDYYSSPSCDPSKKVSDGTVTARSNLEITYDADTLGGSSGAAVFNAQNQVIALHHVGLGGNGMGRGTGNKGVRMSRILPVLRDQYAFIFNSAPPANPPAQPTEPTEPTTPPAPAADFEPNNDANSAPTVALPFSASGLQLTANDRDMFRVELTGSHNLRVHMAFSHAAGDLDLYVYADGNSSPIAQSIGVTDTEDIQVSLGAGTYFVMAIPYGGATGSYSLSIE
ncbi:MAG: serine protease [Myxococcota bacterium]